MDVENKEKSEQTNEDLTYGALLSEAIIRISSLEKLLLEKKVISDEELGETNRKLVVNLIEGINKNLNK